MTATGRATRVTARTTLTIICAAWLVPVLGLLISSFRTRNAVTSTGWWTVFAPPFRFDQFTLGNYQEVLSGGMGQAFINTVAVAVPAVICPLLAAAFAAYAFAWMPMPGRNLIFAVIVALLVVPVQSTLIPLLRGEAGVRDPDRIDVPDYMDSVPKEIMESARVDGASHFSIFWRFALPLSTPAVAAFAIFQFLWVWNDFLVALVFLGGRPDVQVVTLKLQTMIGSLGESWYLLTAGAFVTMGVPVIVFLVLQRYFVRGLTAGSAR